MNSSSSPSLRQTGTCVVCWTPTWLPGYGCPTLYVAPWPPTQHAASPSFTPATSSTETSSLSTSFVSRVPPSRSPTSVSPASSSRSAPKRSQIGPPWSERRSGRARPCSTRNLAPPKQTSSLLALFCLRSSPRRCRTPTKRWGCTSSTASSTATAPSSPPPSRRTLSTSPRHAGATPASTVPPPCPSSTPSRAPTSASRPHVGSARPSKWTGPSSHGRARSSSKVVPSWYL
mmetsp:Transcript_32285/g.69751  ORF Transcript_32285/g.69751 Transcript_32285/m.69751 type:complete len:231 (-) Transcript_32285:31-723(-)